jgi:hypothetical protein
MGDQRASSGGDRQEDQDHGPEGGDSRESAACRARALSRPRSQTAEQGFLTVSDLRRGAAIENLPAAGKGFPLLVVYQPRQGARQGAMTVLQHRGKRVLGGNTFVLRRAKTK